MLYKFKSQVTSDLIMLEANGRQMLTLIGIGDADKLVKGILEAADMPAAMGTLQRAIAEEDEASGAGNAVDAPAEGDAAPKAAGVSLRQRAAPFLKMMHRCHAENSPIVWGT